MNNQIYQKYKSSYNINMFNPKNTISVNRRYVQKSTLLNIIHYPPNEIILPTYYEKDTYDVNKVIINTPIKFNLDLEKKKKSDINILYEKKIKTINNVYQQAYKNHKPSGFGDFIRGCYYLLQFCDTYKFEYNIFINHPIALFLDKFYNKFFEIQNSNKTTFENISMCLENNWDICTYDKENYIVGYNHSLDVNDIFINYLSDLNVIDNSLFMYNIIFPYKEISEKHRKIIRDLLQPNEEMINYINTNLDLLGLCENCYSIIQVRCGDKYFNNRERINNNFINKIAYEINKLILLNTNIQFFLISDNNEIKSCLIAKFPTLRSQFKKITHLGEGNILYNETVKNTLLEFYFMSKSNFIYTYSAYPHGSSFSYWCSKTYNIPHKCKYVSE